MKKELKGTLLRTGLTIGCCVISVAVTHGLGLVFAGMRQGFAPAIFFIVMYLTLLTYTDTFLS